ncbi:MAG: tyrosine-type recombinase/integrase [Nostoc sp.]|uniref:tyrosine-type recombinase/integrase n=1 Tax=Nostoc sp. TaxID=1180 RepID=UPI002FF92D39
MSLELKNEDKWINVDLRTKKLVIRFWVKGFPKQFFISTGLKDTKRNREIVRSKRDAIATDIALSRLDSTLNSYQFRANEQTNPAALVLKTSESKFQIDLSQLWEKFTEFQSSQLEQTTILGKYRKTANMIRQLPTRNLNEAPKIRDWLLTNFSHFTAWANLTDYSRCCKWACDSELIAYNPFEKVQLQKPKIKHRNCKAFTLEQRDLIIESFERHSIHQHYAALVKFLFWTGARPGEAFALTWGDISQDYRRISINKSRNFKGIKKGTKNGKQRVFPAQEGSKLHQLLIDIKPKNTVPTDLIFFSKAAKPINSDTFLDFWKEDHTKSQSNAYRSLGVVMELANQGKVPYLKPYATRHTFATWAITSGLSVDKVARLIGDTVQTVLKYYCHPEIVDFECPDF